jgi:hypothetical protein
MKNDMFSLKLMRKNCIYYFFLQKQQKNDLCVFWAKHKIFKPDVEDFSTIQNFFLCSKVLEGLKYAKKRGYQANFEKCPFPSHHNTHLQLRNICNNIKLTGTNKVMSILCHVVISDNSLYPKYFQT